MSKRRTSANTGSGPQPISIPLPFTIDRSRSPHSFFVLVVSSIGCFFDLCRSEKICTALRKTKHQRFMRQKGRCRKSRFSPYLDQKSPPTSSAQLFALPAQRCV